MSRSPHLRESPLVFCAILGSFDGVNSGISAVLGAAHVSTSALLKLVICIALGSAISMGGGEWCADNESGIKESLMMGSATFAGMLLPVVPLLVLHAHHTLALCCCFVLCVGYAALVARIRGHHWRHYLQSIGILLAVMGVVYGASRLV